MSLLFLSSARAPSSFLKQNKVFSLKANLSSSPILHIPFVREKNPHCITRAHHLLFEKDSCGFRGSTTINCTKPDYQFSGEEDTEAWDFGDLEKEGFENGDSPWEGAVIYKRNSSVSHVEYCTTLERLGLGKLSTEFSRNKASIMGLRVTNAVKDYPSGTPVQISVDITRKKQKLRLDGIIRSVITLECNRCGQPAAEPVFLNLTLLLMAEPIEEPESVDMGTIYGEDKKKKHGGVAVEKERDEDDEIEFEDRLYFPPEVKEIDISKHIRDLVHLEIVITAVCDPKCKGICLRCWENLNTSSCNCSSQEEEREPYGPLGDLREKMQAKK